MHRNNKFINGKNSIYSSVASVLLGLLISVVFVVLSSSTGFFDSISLLFRALWEGSFGSKNSLIETLVFTTPLLFTGLAHSLAFKTGLFNIGVEGQFVIGMLAAGLVGIIPGIPPILHSIFALIAAALGGLLWAVIPGYLKAKTGSNEVVNSIMMNFIAMYLSNYIVRRIKPPGTEATPLIEKNAELWRFLGSNYRLNIGIFIALVLIIGVYYLLWKTTVGYELRAVGFNIFASEYAGINIKKNIILAMALSGCIAGLGGGAYVTGVQHQVYSLFYLPGFGNDGIAVALVAKSNPFGVILSSILFGALNLSSGTLMLYGISKSVSYLIQGTVILFIASEFIYRFIGTKKKKEAAKDE